MAAPAPLEVLLLSLSCPKDTTMDWNEAGFKPPTFLSKYTEEEYAWRKGFVPRLVAI